MNRQVFYSQGHFANYCRKIVYQKIKEKDVYQTISINQTIWNVYDSNNIDVQQSFINALSNLAVTESSKGFNKQLKSLAKKFGKVVNE